MSARVEVYLVRRWGSRAVVAALVGAIATLACQETTGVQWVDSVSLQPDSLYLVPGESGSFDVVPMDQNDNALPERASRVDWTLATEGVATLETSETGATVTAIAAGATFVRVELGRGSGLGSIYVEPFELSEIRIEPSPVVVDYRGDRVTVRAVLVGPDGEEVPATGFRASWRIGDTDIFIMVGRQEVLTGVSNSVFGRTRGSASLTLVVGDRKVTTSVTVR